MEDKNLAAILEAILFASPLPVELRKLTSILDKPGNEIEETLEYITQKCLQEDRGIALVRKGDHFRFITKKEYAQTIASYITSRKSHLSNAAMETLAITAYNQPVTKTYISQIRGITSGEIVDALTEKGLLAESGKLDLPGRPMGYVTTDKFLTVFNLNTIDDLPQADFIDDDLTAEIPQMPQDISETQTVLQEAAQ